MSKLSLIERIRQQPEPVRIRYLFLSAGICSVFIVILWVFSFRESLGIITSSYTVNEVFQDIQSSENVKDIHTEMKTSLEGILHNGENLQEALQNKTQTSENSSSDNKGTFSEEQPLQEESSPSVLENTNNLPAEGNDLVIPKQIPLQ